MAEKIMNDDRQAELEKQVAKLAAEVASLKRFITIGFIVLGVLLVVAFTAPAMVGAVAAIGLAIWAVAHIGSSIGRTLIRRSQRKKRPYIA